MIRITTTITYNTMHIFGHSTAHIWTFSQKKKCQLTSRGYRTIPVKETSFNIRVVFEKTVFERQSPKIVNLGVVILLKPLLLNCLYTVKVC